MQRAGRTRRQALAAVAAAASGPWLAGFSRAPQDEQARGSIRITRASLDVPALPLAPGDTSLARLQLDATLQLSPAMRAGLDSGVPLVFVLQLVVVRRRRWWPDRRLLRFQARYSLVYYELTRHYRLQSLQDQTSRNFRSLLPALDGLGRIRDVPVPLEGSQTEHWPPLSALQGRVSLALDSQALPLPLQPLFTSEWRLASEEYSWPLN